MKLFLTVMILSSFPAMGGFFRYVDLTVAMDVLARGPLSDSIAADMRCFELTGTEDSLVLRGFNRNEPFAVFGLSPEITVIRNDSSVHWQMDELCYSIELDILGRPLLLSRLDPYGATLSGPEGGAYVQWSWINDSTVTVLSLDSLQRPLQIKLRPLYSSTAAKLNDFSELVYFSFGSTAAAGLQYVIDSSGRTIGKKAVDRTGGTVVSSEGAAEVRYSYDSSGNTVSTAWFNAVGELMPGDYVLPLEGNWEFDEEGVVVNGSSIAYVRREYDENSLYISEENISTSGEPVEDSEGRALSLYQREIHGGITESTWYDLQGDRTEVAGIWATRRIYNHQGRVLETSTWNDDDEITEFPGGFAYTRFSYTDSGQTEMLSYFDSAGSPVINTSQGCHARCYRYNEDSRLIELRFLDTEYNLCDNAAGYARVIYVNDEEILFDMNGDKLGN